MNPAIPASIEEDASSEPLVARRTGTVYRVLGAISFSHMLNDMMQSMLIALYPVLKHGLDLSFGEVGLLTLTYQFTASLLQPLVGLTTDKRPMPRLLPAGMLFTFVGLLTLSVATTFERALAAAALIGVGSSIFHPESSRVARAAAGRQPGLAQSFFQVGGNLGSAVGPLAAMLVVALGQRSVACFSVAALLGVFVLHHVSRWHEAHATPKLAKAHADAAPVSNATVVRALVILGVLVFSKYVYMASLQSFYTFYLMEKFHLPLATAQLYLFAFLFSVALGTIVGGPFGDRVGRKRVIWISILGVAPFTLALPYANLPMTAVLSVIIGLVLASAFSAILVYAQELVPGKVGAISGLFFGFAFGMAGLGAALLGRVADATSVEFVYRICAFLPLLGLLTAGLPDVKGDAPARAS